MQAWSAFVAEQEKLLGQSVSDKWLKCLKVVHFDALNLYLEAKDPFQVEWFEQHIRPQLKSKLLTSNGRSIKVHLTHTSMPPKPKAATAPPPPLFAQDTLDPDKTLSHFVASTSNAHLLRLCSELPAPSKFNPLYIWGPSGCGKTHLLMALTHAFRSQGLKALYAKTETFTQHVVSAIRHSEMHLFRNIYRHVDVLLIDDVHHLSRKFATQEEFFHTFNTLHSSNRQLILTSQHPPSLLEEIEPRLTSRFEWGLTVSCEALSPEDLKEIFHKRLEALHFPLSEEICTYLLTTFPSLQPLFRALETLVLRCHLERSEKLDMPSVERTLGALIQQEQTRALSPEKIQEAVATLYAISTQELLGKSQTHECSLPRQIAMYLCREELKLPFQAIARLFDRDHSTVMTSIKQIESKVRAADPHLLTSLRELRRHLSP